jgi:Ca-activated chloride channel family protein
MKLLFTLLCSLPFFLNAQCITGVVTDSNDGSPLIGVSVLWKSTRQGTVTDLDGKFSLCVSSADSVVLVMTYTGYETLEMTVALSQKLGVVKMESGGELLEEVVVAAYGIQRKEASIGDAVRASGSRRALKNSRSPRPSAYASEPIQTEQYNAITRNGFIKTKKQNFSTISTDVDRAAYANVRRILNEGKMPPSDAVRTEELINYFKYQDPNPKTEKDIALRTEFMTCPWNEQNQLLRVSARTMPIATADLPPANLVFLLDVSGSMSRQNKLPLVKESLKLLTQSLRAEDKVAIVVYAGAAGLVLPSTSGKDPATIMAALDRLQSGGSTAGGAGITLAYDVARKHFVQGGNNRIILATDGDFNVGTSSQEGLLNLIEKERESGIYLTVLGFGTGNYQEGTMQELADRGNGNHGYIDSPAEAKKILVSEFGGTMFTVAKDVKLQLEFDPEVVASYRLIGYENRLLAKEDFDDDTKDAAEMGAGHNVTVLYELIPANKYREANYLGYLRLRYKPNTGGPSKKESYPVSANHHTDEAASNDIRWAAAVAEFSMLLTDSKHKGAANWKHCLEMANNSIGKDTEGYRAEMIGLIIKAQAIAKK